MILQLHFFGIDDFLFICNGAVKLYAPVFLNGELR